MEGGYGRNNVLMYGKGTMRPVEPVLRIEKERIKMGGVNL
jgi:hypothetical protein